MTIQNNIKTLLSRIRNLELSSHRIPGSVELLAVSKGQTIERITQAFEAGLCDFGENYLQEALGKIHALNALPIRWHFIGAIQSNKTHAISHHFDWVHSVCRKKIAQRLNDERPNTLCALNVCIQVNIDDSNEKAGIAPHLVSDLAMEIIKLPRLNLRGLMVITKLVTDEEQYQLFLNVSSLLDQLNTDLNLKLDTLSMGMTQDLHTAIRAGSTIVRIGRGIFGERK